MNVKYSNNYRLLVQTWTKRPQLNSFILESSLTVFIRVWFTLQLLQAFLFHICTLYPVSKYCSHLALFTCDAGYYMMLYVLSLRANINWEILLLASHGLQCQ